MSETKHTPEPWEVRGLYICASTDTYIAKMLHGDNLNPPDQETYGNANLIAAAPDMLAALKALLSDGRVTHAAANWNPDGLRLCREAIAAAEGETK